jgi:hypothetical protein
MRPSPSLHYVSTLLDQRRRRHQRARRLWGAGLGLLGGGLLLVGWWVTLRLPPKSPPPAGVIPPVVVPVPASGATGTRGLPREPLWGRPVLLEPGTPQDHPCQTLPPWRVACTPVDVFASEFSPLPLPAVGTLSGPRPPGLPESGDRPPPLLASPSCGATPCPTGPDVRRPEPGPVRRPKRRRPRALRPARPVHPQRPVSDDVPPALAEPERPAVSP